MRDTHTTSLTRPAVVASPTSSSRLRPNLGSEMRGSIAADHDRGKKDGDDAWRGKLLE